LQLDESNPVPLAVSTQENVHEPNPAVIRDEEENKSSLLDLISDYEG